MIKTPQFGSIFLMYKYTLLVSMTISIGTMSHLNAQPYDRKLLYSVQNEYLVQLKQLLGSKVVSPRNTVRRNIARTDMSKSRRQTTHSTKNIVSNIDDQRPDDQYTIKLFGRDLTIGGEYEIRGEKRVNYALSNSDNDRERLRNKLELEFNYDVSEHVKALIETKLISSADHRVDRRSHLDSLERGETWVDITKPLNNKTLMGIRVGRQNFSDKREWWWNKDLDAIRFYYKNPTLSYELNLAEELGGRAANQPLEEKDNDLQRIFGKLKWEYSKGHKLELFMLNHDDQSSTPSVGSIVPAAKEDKSDAQLNWYGIRARGKGKIKDLGKVRYWADVATVKGKETLLDFNDINDDQIEVTDVKNQSVRGNAFDVGLTLRTKLSGLPSFTFGLAQGSGDSNPDDGIDRAFRQTGIHKNNGKYRGVDSFRYYGELLRPELSNLRVSTLSVGYPLFKDSSIEVLYHRYNQLDASTQLNSRLRISPSGLQTHIGDEIDIVLGLEEWKKVELEFVGSVFRGGDAFEDREGDLSFFVGAKFNYNF